MIVKGKRPQPPLNQAATPEGRDMCELLGMSANVPA